MIIEDIVVHPNFTDYQHDLALLRLPKSSRNSLVPICLAGQEDFLHLRCIATGWGQTVENSSLEAKIHQVALRVVDTPQCAELYDLKYGLSLASGHLCAGPLIPGGAGTCVGDSGGPLQCNLKDGLWYLAGITSFGSGCAKPGFPDVFVRISEYTDWIQDVILQYQVS